MSGMTDFTRREIARKATSGLSDPEIRGIGSTANLILQAGGHGADAGACMQQATKWAGYDLETVTACCYLVRARAV